MHFASLNNIFAYNKDLSSRQEYINWKKESDEILLQIQKHIYLLF